MAAIVGVIALALGACLLVLWWSSVVAALKGALVLFVLAFGVLALIVHHAGNKARRDYQTAKTQDPMLSETDSTQA